MGSLRKKTIISKDIQTDSRAGESQEVRPGLKLVSQSKLQNTWITRGLNFTEGAVNENAVGLAEISVV